MSNGFILIAVAATSTEKNARSQTEERYSIRELKGVVTRLCKQSSTGRILTMANFHKNPGRKTFLQATTLRLSSPF
jgi:hypothetical protein